MISFYGQILTWILGDDHESSLLVKIHQLQGPKLQAYLSGLITSWGTFTLGSFLFSFLSSVFLLTIFAFGFCDGLFVVVCLWWGWSSIASGSLGLMAIVVVLVTVWWVELRRCRGLPSFWFNRGDDEITNTVAMIDRIDTNSESKDLQTKILQINSLDINSMCRGIIGGSCGLGFCTRVWCSTTAHKQQKVVLEGKTDKYYISGLRGG